MVYLNHKSRSFLVCRGVPQEFALGPVLFSLFINNLSVSLPSSVSCSLYADDLAIWFSSPSVPTAVEAAQGALFWLERWSEYWCLPLNPRKCEASSFSVDPHKANLQSNLVSLNSRPRFYPTSTFLGVTFDRTLSLSKHVSSLKAKFFPRFKALRCISASSWGPSKESLSLFLLLGICLRSLRSLIFPLHAPALISLFLAKVRLSPTLTISTPWSGALYRRLCPFSFWQRRLWRICQLLSQLHWGHSFLFSRPSMLKFLCWNLRHSART